MSFVVFVFYKNFLAPLAYCLLQILRPLTSGKLREMIEDKNHRHTRLKSDRTETEIRDAQPFWIHAASGEIEYARPVIRELKKLYPEIPLLVTYSSPSAKKILDSIHEIDAWSALPWDLSGDVKQFLARWNPRLILFSRTDVWPVLSQVCRSKQIPAILFSATFADNSSRLKGLTRYLTRYSLNQLSSIQCVTEQDIQNLQPLLLNTALTVTGDTRFDQVFHRLENPKPLKNLLIPRPEDFVFIAGSTWPEDEAVLLPALARMQGSGCKVILAPHETGAEHLAFLEKEMKRLGISYVRYSQTETWRIDEVLLVDQVGLLAELYTWGDIAFIGGSFRKQVHSVMEALAAGLPVLVGPCHLNNREALLYQRKNFSSGLIVQIVHTSEDVFVLVERLKKKQGHLTQIKSEIRLEVEKNRHSTLKVIAEIQRWI